MKTKAILSSLLIYGSAIVLFTFGKNHMGLSTLSLTEFLLDTACLATMLVGLKLSDPSPRLFKLFIGLFLTAFMLSNYVFFRLGWNLVTGFPAPTALLALIASWSAVIIILARSKE